MSLKLATSQQPSWQTDFHHPSFAFILIFGKNPKQTQVYKLFLRIFFISITRFWGQTPKLELETGTWWMEVDQLYHPIFLSAQKHNKQPRNARFAALVYDSLLPQRFVWSSWNTYEPGPKHTIHCRHTHTHAPTRSETPEPTIFLLSPPVGSGWGSSNRCSICLRAHDDDEQRPPEATLA